MKIPRLRPPRLGRYQEAGSAPGIPYFDETAAPPRIHAIGYGADSFEETDVGDPSQLRDLLGEWPVLWIDVVGLGGGRELEVLRETFDIHPLALEDVVNVGHRAKVEPYEDHLFMIGRMAGEPPPLTEQVSMFLGGGWLLTIQERAGDPFEGVRERIRAGRPRIRSRGPDYLAYALLDAIVDSYFPLLDRIGDELEVLEEEVLADPGQETVQKVHFTRRMLIGLRKALGPHREAINVLLRGDDARITHETGLFLRDVYDHAIRSGEMTETYREMTSDLMSTYLSAVSNRMNEVMKVLTIIASIFIPLSFIAGLYGMNFDPSVSDWNMPELGWRFGYPFALGLMFAVGAGFLLYMWKRGWLK